MAKPRRSTSDTEVARSLVTWCSRAFNQLAAPGYAYSVPSNFEDAKFVWEKLQEIFPYGSKDNNLDADTRDDWINAEHWFKVLVAVTRDTFSG